MLDAALFEPGQWQPDQAKASPSHVPAADRAAMATPAGLLFQELTHAPAPLLVALRTIMHNALELDAGRYVRGGASATILYATRLALRVGLYASLTFMSLLL